MQDSWRGCESFKQFIDESLYHYCQLPSWIFVPLVVGDVKCISEKKI